MAKKILVIGAGDGVKEVIFYINRINQLKNTFEVVGFIDDNVELHGRKIFNHEILGGLNWIEENNENFYCNINMHNPKIRADIVKKLETIGVKFTNIIDPSAQIDWDSVELGEGIIIGATTTILPNVTINDHVIIDYGTSVGHDCKLDKYVTVSPNVGIAGNSNIGEGVFIGIGVNIIQHIEIGSWSVIGAGSVVVNNIPPEVVSYGVPAKVMRKRD